MSKPFDRLQERLLTAGISPRTVNRYLRELEDHLADLTADCNRNPTDPRAAEARLGTIDDLAEAMIAQPTLKSWTARAPWAALVLAPLIAWSFASIAGIALLIMIVQQHRGADGGPAILPGWFAALETGVTGLSLYLLPVLIGWLVVRLAIRQRIVAAWPLLGLAAIAVIGGSTQIDLVLPTAPGVHGELSLGMGIFPPYGEFANSIARIAANLLLTLPVYLLLRRPRLQAAG